MIFLEDTKAMNTYSTTLKNTEITINNTIIIKIMKQPKKRSHHEHSVTTPQMESSMEVSAT